MKGPDAKMLRRAEAIVSAAPLVYYLLLLPELPERVPTHFGPDGTADGFSGRFSAGSLAVCLIGYVGMLLGAGVSRFCSSLYDGETERNRDVGKRILTLNEAVLCLFFTIMALYNVSLWRGGGDLDDGFLLKLGVAVFALVLMVTGNLLPKFEFSRNSGARTKYSLSGEKAWSKTQRFAGRVLMLAGAALLVITLLPMVSAGAAVIAAVAAVVAACAAALGYMGGKAP